MLFAKAPTGGMNIDDVFMRADSQRGREDVKSKLRSFFGDDFQAVGYADTAPLPTFGFGRERFSEAKPLVVARLAFKILKAAQSRKHPGFGFSKVVFRLRFDIGIIEKPGYDETLL